MSNAEIIMIVAGLVAVVAGGVDLVRTSGQAMSAWGVVALGIAFILLSLI